MKWLLDSRIDFGDSDWAGLVGGGERVVVECREGTNHFSLMVGEQVGRWRGGGEGDGMSVWRRGDGLGWGRRASVCVWDVDGRVGD